MTTTTETLYISYDHRSYAVTIERKAVKNITLRLYRHGTLKLSAAPDVPVPHLQDFLQRHSRRIFAALTRLQSMPQSPAITLQDGESLRLGGLPYTLSWCTGTQNRVKKSGHTVYMYLTDRQFSTRRRLYYRLLRREGECLFADSVRRMFPKFRDYAVSFPAVKQRRMHARWGSCLMPAGIITFNTYLAVMPPRLIDHVTVHEMCHLIHPDHSRRFYQVMTEIMPDWQERRKALSDYLPYCI